jgi:ABC-type multidrug transport system fused ATPase/permease subunit
MQAQNILYASVYSLFPFLRPYWKGFILSLLCTIIFALSNVYIMPLVNDIVREVSNNNLNYFTNHIFNASLLFFFRLSSKYLQLFIMEKISYKIMLDIQLKLYHLIHYLPTNYYATKKHGDIISRMLDDCNKIKHAIFLNFESLLPNTITLIGVTGYLFYLCWPLALLSIVGVPIFILTLKYFSKRLRKVSQQLQQNTADLTHMIQESLLNMKIIQIYNFEEKNISLFRKIQHRYITGYIKEIKFRITREQIDAYSQFVIFLFIIWCGGYLSHIGYISSSQLISFFTGIIVLVEPITILTKVYAQTYQTTASIDRVNDYLEQPSLQPQSSNTDPLHFKTINFRNVYFTYPKSDRPALTDISFHINQGDFIGIVGPSGAGKSSLVNLVSKFYSPQSGQICIDNMDIASMSAQHVRQHIAYVPQESLLFQRSILENCRIGRPSTTSDEVVEALKLANAWEFVKELPDSILTRIGTQGLTLSGGQRQRLSIARAIITNPKLLILDEATSALDSHSEEKIQTAIASLKGKFSILVIAHRLSTIKDASSIIVLDNGHIVEQGTHATLVKNEGMYATLLQKQQINAV